MKTGIKLKFPCVLWVRNIENALEIYSYGELENYFLRKANKYFPDFWCQCSRRFYHYAHGIKTPSEKFRRFVERYVKGSYAIFNQPLWKILENPEASEKDINQWLKELEPKVYAHLFQKSKRHGISPRRDVRGYFYVGNIAKENSQDALAATLMLMREAELNQDYVTFVSCQWEATDLLVRLALYHPFNEVAESIYDLVYKQFISKNKKLMINIASSDRSLQAVLYRAPSKKINFTKQLNRYLELVHFALMNKQIIQNEPRETLEYLYHKTLLYRRIEEEDDPIINNPILKMFNTFDHLIKLYRYARSHNTVTSVQMNRYTQQHAIIAD